MKTIRDLKRVKTVEDLEGLGIGDVRVDIGHRGGGVGFSGADVASYLQNFGCDVYDYHLPKCYGAGCNYLGGGIRGAIFPSGFSKEITGKAARFLEELGQACVRAYKNAENGTGLNSSDDGDVNWDAEATKAARASGVLAAY